MTKSSFQDELERKARRAILVRSFYRWESAAIIALTLILFFLVPQPLPFWQACASGWKRHWNTGTEWMP